MTKGFEGHLRYPRREHFMNIMIKGIILWMKWMSGCSIVCADKGDGIPILVLNISLTHVLEVLLIMGMKVTL